VPDDWATRFGLAQRKHFKRGLKSEDEFKCPEPRSFLSQSDVEEILPIWKDVFNGDLVFEAIESLRSSAESERDDQVAFRQRSISDTANEGNEDELEWFLAQLG